MICAVIIVCIGSFFFQEYCTVASLHGNFSGEIPNPYTLREGVHEHANIGGAFVYVIPPLLRILQRMFVLFRQNPGFLYFSDLYNQVLGEHKSEHTTKHSGRNKKLDKNRYIFFGSINPTL